MVELSRRGFLKVGVASVAGVLLAKYAEPVMSILDNKGDWITDKGDYYILRIPDFKSFANHKFDKPLIVVMGESSRMHHTTVQGMTNIIVPKGGEVTECEFNCKEFLTEEPRPVVKVSENSNKVTITDAVIIGGPTTSYCIDFGSGASYPTIDNVNFTANKSGLTYEHIV